jgi:hypothetical protein
MIEADHILTSPVISWFLGGKPTRAHLADTTLQRSDSSSLSHLQIRTKGSERRASRPLGVTTPWNSYHEMRMILLLSWTVRNK